MAGKHRSPNYPSVGLPEAINLVRGLWAKEKRTAVPPEVAVKALGYNSLSGPARVKLATLKKYGLIEDEANGVRVSGLALEFLQHPEGSAEFRAAAQKAAFGPELFSQLVGSYRDASNDALHRELVYKRGFSEQAASQVIKAFRDTLSLLDSSGEPESSGPEADALEPAQPGAFTTDRGKSGPGGVLLLKVPFGSTSLNVRIEVPGEILKKSHVARVRKYLELAEADLPEEG